MHGFPRTHGVSNSARVTNLGHMHRARKNQSKVNQHVRLGWERQGLSGSRTETRGKTKTVGEGRQGSREAVKKTK